MKKLYILIITSLFFIGCSNNIINNSKDKEDTSNSEYGKIIFSINGETSSARSAVPLSFLTGRNQYFTVFMYNETEEYKLQFNEYDGSASDPSFDVKAGTYNAVMLAGVNGNYSGAIGSGNVKEIVVIANTVTNVDFTLRPFDYEISAPTTPVFCGEEYDVSFKFDTRNDLLYQPRLYIYETKPTSNFDNRTTVTNTEKLSEFSGTLKCNATNYVSTKNNDVYVQLGWNFASDTLTINDSTYNKSIKTGIGGQTVDASANYSTGKEFYGLSYTFVTHKAAPNPDDPTLVKIGITWVQ